MIIESYINKGNSFPIILTDKGRKYFVKLRAGMSGNYSLINEWIGNKLGMQLGIKTQTPIWIELPRDLQTANIHLEVQELVQKSVGLNIAFDYQLNALDVKEQDLNTFDRRELIDIFLFDLLIINIDRTSNNMNLMKVGKNLLSVDYESSLLVQDIIEDKKLLENSSILKCFRNNPLYQPINDHTVNQFLKKAEQLSIKEILLALPKSLVTIEEVTLLIQQFEERKRKKWFLQGVLDNLKSISQETSAEQKVRINKNQAAFKRKFKENL